MDDGRPFIGWQASDFASRESVCVVEDIEVFGRLVERLLRDGADVVVAPCAQSVADSNELPCTVWLSTCERPADIPDVHVVLRPRLPSLEFVSLAACWAWLGEKARDEGRSLGLQTSLFN